jgi:hypothetical protein
MSGPGFSMEQDAESKSVGQGSCGGMDAGTSLLPAK